MTSTGSYSDRTGYSPTSPTPTTSPALSLRSLSTPITSIYMSDSDSANRESDAPESSGRPTRERKQPKRFIAGATNIGSSLTRPTAASAARTAARRPANTTRAASMPVTGLPATHNIRRHIQSPNAPSSQDRPSLPHTTSLPPSIPARPDISPNTIPLPISP